MFEVIFTEGFTRTYLVDTVNRAAPYYISGVAVAIGFKMNLFNIGVEGQYKLAALFAAAAGAAIELPAPLHVLFIFLVAMAVGAAWAAIPGLLKAYRGVSEVISSIMLNATALGVGAFFLGRWLRQPAAESPVLGTRPMAESARLPTLNGLLGGIGIDIPDATRVQSYIVVAALVGVAYYLLIWRSRYGFDLRATGSNADAAAASGVNAKRMIITAMLFSGATAGLIGLNNIMGPSGRYSDVSVVSGLGFTGIAIALLGPQQPDRHRLRRPPVGVHGCGPDPALQRRVAQADHGDHAGHHGAVRGHRLRGGAPDLGPPGTERPSKRSHRRRRPAHAIARQWSRHRPGGGTRMSALMAPTGPPPDAPKLPRSPASSPP